MWVRARAGVCVCEREGPARVRVGLGARAERVAQGPHSVGES